MITHSRADVFFMASCRSPLPLFKVKKNEKQLTYTIIQLPKHKRIAPKSSSFLPGLLGVSGLAGLAGIAVYFFQKSKA
jgi:hypothetical protein